MPTVDILIPTYNPKREHLTAALRCVQAQTMQDWRLLVHDDFCETSQAASIVEPFLADPRIIFRKSPVRLGIGGNWNACVAEGKAPFVAFIFQDDIWEPGYLEESLKALHAHPSAGFASVKHRYQYEGSVPNADQYEALQAVKHRDVRPGLHHGKTFLQWWIARELSPNVIGEPSFVVLRRSVMEQAGTFLMDMPQSLDVEYWIRMLVISDWVNIPLELGAFRVHPSGTSAVNNEAGQGLFDRLRNMERLVELLDGEDRRVAVKARNAAVEKMVEKFFQRVRSGKRVSSKGSGVLKKFCLRHPLLITRSILKYQIKRIGG
jgi:glycosyltransferase involved in cell wall biosynthesis